MKTIFEDGSLILTLKGRITADNADALSMDIANAVEEYPNAVEIYFDAAELLYISSAGLRVLLKLQKERNTKIHVINVSDTVADIFESTGFNQLMYVRKPLKTISMEGLEMIGKGRAGAAYRLDEERIIKIYFDKKTSTITKIDRDRNISQEMFLRGIPTAIPYDVVMTDMGYGVIYEMVNGATLREYMYTHPDKLDGVLEQVASLIRKLHTTDGSDLKLMDSNRFVVDNLRAYLLPMIPDDKKENVSRFLDQIPNRRGSNRLP